MLTICLAQAKGSTATKGNFIKATMACLAKTYQVSYASRVTQTQAADMRYQFQSPDLWQIIPAGLSPYDEHAAHLQMAARKAAAY
jgi:small subunit ribosomal protein S2e